MIIFIEESSSTNGMLCIFFKFKPKVEYKTSTRDDARRVASSRNKETAIARITGLENLNTSGFTWEKDSDIKIRETEKVSAKKLHKHHS